MKRILLLSLLLLPIVALAQYPTFSNKQRLGVQTTGDGLIFRGNQEVPNYIPSNVNNAYFYLDTVTNKFKFYNNSSWQQIYPVPQFDTTLLNVYLKISDTTAMLVPYFRDSDTTSLNLINRFALKLNISDTATMLTPYMKKADTISLSNRIDLKLNISDTTILSNRITTNANNIITINNKLATKLDTVYVKFKNVVTMIENKDTINIGSSLTDGYAINIIGDSVNVDSVILDARYPDRDSTNELQSITFATTTGVITVPASKVMNLDTLYNNVIDSVNLLIRDSIAAFTPLTEGYGINIIGDSINIDTTIIFTQSDTTTLSNRIDLKLNISDTTNMLAPYLREADTTSLSNRINTKIDTIYVNYQTNVDVITNKDTININPQLTEGFGINIIADSINIDSAVILATQQKQIAYVKNQSGITIYKGQAVYSSGSSGENKLVTLASSSTEQASSKTFGVVESDSIPNGSHGYIITFGLLSGINTNLLTEGLSIYLSNTPGQLTTIKPQAPLHMVVIGVCIRQQQNNGSIFVKIQNGFEFDELHDVRITTPVDKSSVYYNLSENLWRDTTAALLVSDTATMLNPYLRKLDTITLSNRINLKFNAIDTSILGYVTTYSNQYNINGNKTFNNTVSVDSLNATKQAKIQSLTVGKGGYAIIGGTPGAISSTAFGFEALKNNTSGDWNTAIGYQTLLNNTTGWNNVAIGNNALSFNTLGEYNTVIGVDALISNVVGNYNTVIGYNAGSKGNNNIFIGSNTSHSDSINNTLMIGGITTPLLSGTLTGNKKLGINTNPLNLTYTFEVNSNISNSVKINSNTNSTNLELMNSGGSVFIKSGNKNMTLQTDTTALVYLKGDVNRVGILTMNPQQALQVAGTIRVDSLVNNYTPDKLVGANNANDLTDIKIGTGLSFLNDTLKVADNIINSGDTATLLRKDFVIDTNVLVWKEGNKKLIPYFTQVYRNGQLLKSLDQYTITNDSIVTLETGNYRLGDNITIIAIDNIVALAGSGGTITLQGDVSGSSSTNTITTSIGSSKVLNSMLAGNISNDKLDVISAANKVSNSATTATNLNNANTIVSRDALGNFNAGTITASLNGNAATVTTNANLTGDVTSTGNTTSIATGVIVNNDINASAGIAVSKLAASTISGVTLGSNLNTLTISAPLTGLSYNGSSAVTIGIQAATTSVAGSMSAADKTKLDGIAAGAQVNVATNLAQGTRTTTTVPITSSTGTSATLDIATTSLAGVMSSADKTKLDGIASGATANTGTVTSVSGTGTVSGLTLTGSVTTSGNLTLGGTLSLTSGNVTTALGYTPYNATNPNSYINRTGLSFVAGSGDYNSTTGVITIPTNNNQITNGAGYITSSSLSSYLPLTGGTLTGGLTGTTGGFSTKLTAGNVGGSSGSPVFTAGLSGTETEFHIYQGTGYEGSPTTLRLTNNNGSYYQNGLFLKSIMERGLNEYNGRIGIMATDFMILTKNNRIGIFNASPSYTLDVNGTLNATGATTIGSTLAVTGDITENGNNVLTSADTTSMLTNYLRTGVASSTYISGSGTANYIPKFDATKSLTSSALINNGSSLFVNPNTQSSFGWDFMTNTSNPFIGNNVKNGSANERLQRQSTTSLFYPSAIIFGFQRVNNSTGATSLGGINFMTTDSDISGDINPIDYSRMFIQPNGNVGVGTMQPNYKFDIRGTLGVTGATTLSTTTATPTSLLGKDGSNVVGSVTLGSSLTLSSGTLSVNNKITDINTSQYTISASDYYIDNFNSSSTTIILPLVGVSINRELKFKNSSTGAIIANGNITPLSGSGTTTTILPATNAKWCTLVCDGFTWRIMQAN